MTLPERYPDGRLKPGHTANPSGRPRVVAELRDLARQHTPDAFRRLLELMGSKNEQVPLAAVRELLDRGYDKAVQAVDKTERRLDIGTLYLEALIAAQPKTPGDGARVATMRGLLLGWRKHEKRKKTAAGRQYQSLIKGMGISASHRRGPSTPVQYAVFRRAGEFSGRRRSDAKRGAYTTPCGGDLLTFPASDISRNEE